MLSFFFIIEVKHKNYILTIKYNKYYLINPTYTNIINMHI